MPRLMLTKLRSGFLVTQVRSLVKYLYLQQACKIRLGSAGVSQVNITYAQVFDGLYHTYKIRRDGNNYSFLIDDVEVATTTSAAATGNNGAIYIGRVSGNYAHADIGYIIFRDSIGGTDLFNWDATASSHAAGTPLLTETVAANSATGVNMPTDGSAWLDLGGSGISIAVDSTLPSLSSSLNLSKVDNSFSIDINSTLPSLSSSLNLKSTDNIFDLSVSSELPSLTSILNLSVVNPGNNASINSFLPGLISSLNLTKTDPATGVSINSELPSLISSLSLSVTNPEFDFSVVSTLPSLSSSLSLYNGVLGISVGDRNNIDIVVKSTNINVITKSRNIEEY